MTPDEIKDTDWSDSEIDLIIADYFDMLRMELAGQSFNKAERNRALQVLTGRTRGSIERKHQNISAVMDRLGHQWINGYKPLRNYQKSLLDGIERHLPSYENAAEASQHSQPHVREMPEIFVEQPPALLPRPTNEPIHLTRLARKFDPAARDERNRGLGKAGEERIFELERLRLQRANRNDLASKVRWVSQEDGDGLGYDISSFDADGRERLVEVKTTGGPQTTPFFVSENELALSVERPDAFRLVRLYDLFRVPRAFEIAPPLAESVLLRAVNFRAEFGPREAIH